MFNHSKSPFKDWIKQFICVLLSLITLSTSVIDVYAKDYVKSDSSGGCDYYIIDGEDVKDLFDFGISDVPNILDWILDFKSYTVIKDYEDSDGNQRYKCYFNTPNLQSIVKNSVIGKISDGYTDDTYDVNETEWIVPVGKNATSENAITKYGFKIPSYTYMGEYPKEVMSPAGIVPSPKRWWEVLWAAIKALFGASFLKAPDADNFNSIRYINHTYTDRSEYVLEYIKQYYLQYFEAQIPVHKAYDRTPEDEDDWGMKGYFESPEDLMAMTVTEDANDDAEDYNSQFEDEYLSALQHYMWWYKYKDNGYSTVGLADGSWFSSFKSSSSDLAASKELKDAEGDTIDGWDNKWDKVKNSDVDITKKIFGVPEDYTEDGWHYLASRSAYKTKFRNWLISNLSDAYVIANSITASNRYKYKNSPGDIYESGAYSGSSSDRIKGPFDTASDYGLDPDSGTFNSGVNDEALVALAADMVRYSYDYIMTHIQYDVQERLEHRDVQSDHVHKTGHTYVTCTITKKDGSSETKTITYDYKKFYYGYGGSGSIGWWRYGDVNEDYPEDLDAAADSASWEAGSSDGASDGYWKTTKVETDDRLYKDVSSWIGGSPIHHTEPLPEGSPSKGSPWTGSPSTTYEGTVHSTSALLPVTVNGSLTWDSGGPNEFVLDFGVSNWDDIDKVVVTDVWCTTEVETTTHYRCDTRTFNQRANFVFKALWDGRGSYDESTTRKITKLTDYTDDFLKTFDFNRYDVNFAGKSGTDNYHEEDMVHPDLQAIYKNYEHNVILMANYRLFNRYMKRGVYDPDEPKSDDLDDLSEIPYRQCMIQNQGEDGECESQKYGDDKTTLTVTNVVVYSGIYKITEKYRSKDYKDSSGNYLTLSTEDAHTLLIQLQLYCGPYYDEVLANMMKLIAYAAEYEGDNGPTARIVDDDSRVMPYDVDTLVPTDKTNYAVVDPRVKLYKDHIIGSLIADFSLEGGFMIFIKPQATIINIAGKITEVSVFLQTICNFDFLDSLGLSPTKMWSDVFVTLLMLALALFFIIKTVIAVIKMGTRSTAKVIIGFLLLALELGFIVTLSINPEANWTKIKTNATKIMNLGELTTVFNNKDLEYLFGGNEDYEVAYYVPYLDCWSKYNTGYGILDTEQKIDSSKDAAELIDFVNPTINGKDIGHWSVLLADSFTYHGRSNLVVNTVQYNGHTVNGSVINNNAYRVVDHFMAPRVTVGKSGSNLTLTFTDNPNYNGEFQKGLGDILVKLANCCLCCFLSVIKLMIFLYFWWQLYLFIFNVILGLGAQGKKFSQVIIETFTPLLALVMWGIYSGICMMVGMDASGFVGFCIIFFMFWLTLMIIRWWHDNGRGGLFPFTLGWLYFLTNLSRANRLRTAAKLEQEYEHDRMDAGIYEQPEETDDNGETKTKSTFAKQTHDLFDDSGNMRSAQRNVYDQDDKVKKVYDNWYKHYLYLRKNYGYTPTQEELAAIRSFERDTKSAERAQSLRDEIDNFKSRKSKPNKLDDYAKIKNNSDKEDADNETK